ncbi:MAG: cbb3-type cytochrome oxidase assembly protein CcoS [Pseudomonadota bacterium]
MSLIVFLLPAALILGVLWLAVFFWCLKSDQYGDTEGAARRILDD